MINGGYTKNLNILFYKISLVELVTSERIKGRFPYKRRFPPNHRFFGGWKHELWGLFMKEEEANKYHNELGNGSVLGRVVYDELIKYWLVYVHDLD